MDHLTDDTDGWDLLAKIARHETARVYGWTSTEYAKVRRQEPAALIAAAKEQLAVVDEIRHFIGFGMSDAAVAVRLGHLGVRKHHVTAVRAAA